jgi:hypothetical protein
MKEAGVSCLVCLPLRDLGGGALLGGGAFLALLVLGLLWARMGITTQ